MRKRGRLIRILQDFNGSNRDNLIRSYQCPLSLATRPKLATHMQSAHEMCLRNCRQTGTVFYKAHGMHLRVRDCLVKYPKSVHKYLQFIKYVHNEI